MQRPRRAICALAAVLVAAIGAAAVPAAQAAPDRSATLSLSSPTFKWTGGPGTSFTTLTDISDQYPCDMPVHDCDYTLLNVTDAGTLKVKTSSTDPKTPDIDLNLYLSDASGAKGKRLQQSAATGPNPNEALAVEAEPGYYLVEVDFADAVLGMFDAEATLVPGEAAPPEETPAAPNSAPKPLIAAPKSGKTVARKKLKGFKGTATDDHAVARVDVALFQVKGSKCKALTPRGSFKTQPCSSPTFLVARGTTKWSFKLRQTLPKGKYVLIARATDDQGATQTAKIAFKTK